MPRIKFAISIAASAASQPLFPLPGDERATACSCVLQVMTPKATGDCVSTATRDKSFVTCAEMNSKCGVSPRNKQPRAMIASWRPARTRAIARNAIDGDVFVARAVTREAVERAVEESGHDVIIETAGDHAEAKTLGIQIAFERARHSGGLYFHRAAARIAAGTSSR